MEDNIITKKDIELKNKYKDHIKEKYLEDSKKRLHTIVERKLRTGFIGALSQFESFFGFIWDKTKRDNLNKEQMAVLLFVEDNNLEDVFKQWWDKAREKVLTNGNNQIRALNDEFNHYTINWDRYVMVLPVKSLPNTKEE